MSSRGDPAIAAAHTGTDSPLVAAGTADTQQQQQIQGSKQEGVRVKADGAQQGQQPVFESATAALLETSSRVHCKEGCVNV